MKKTELCRGKKCQESANPKPVSDWPIAALTKKCGACWKREHGPESFGYQKLVDKDNRLPPRRVLLEEYYAKNQNETPSNQSLPAV